MIKEAYINMWRFTNIYWHSNKDWYTFNKKLQVVMKEDVPKEAKESFRRFKWECRRHDFYIFWRNVKYTIMFWECWL